MKDIIIDLLNKANKPLSEIELLDKIDKASSFSLEDMCNLLREMEVQGSIYKTNSGKYTLYKYTHLIVGRLSINKKGFGFLILEDAPDIYVSALNMKDAIHNDFVAIEKINKEEGKVVKVLNRELKNVVGELTSEKNKNVVSIDTDKYKLNIYVDQEYINNAVVGNIVLVEPFEQIQGNNYKGKIIKILGHKNDPGIDILEIVYNHEVNDIFSEEVILEANNIKDHLSEKDYENRRDLREEIIFTIDSNDAKDYDDAISIKKTEDGNYILGVHIADVSNYVKQGTKLNDEAFNRGNSIYLADRVIPMLPQKLSNGICSLSEGVDRLTVTCEMVIDQKGNVTKYDIYNSVIKSKKRMTYKKVNEILEQNIEVEGYEPFIEHLNKMKELSEIIRKLKINKGYIDFEINEPDIIIDDLGKPTDVKLRERGVAEKLIEDFMIITNETVANYVFWMGYPFIYRVHGAPKEERIDNFLSIVSNLGHTVKGNKKNITSKFIRNILDDLKKYEDYDIVSEFALRSMQKASYSVENIGHFGLASEIYAHFTSPIRRYSDLVVHTLLKSYLNNDYGNKYENLSFIAEHVSRTERIAIECEREVNDMKMAEYMSNHIGEEFKGIISGIIPSGLFVRLPNMIEGFVHVSELGEDYFVYNKKLQMFIGKEKGKKYKLGERVKIKVAGASKEDRTIDFDLI